MSRPGRRSRQKKQRATRSSAAFRNVVNPYDPPKPLSDDEVAYLHDKAVGFLRDDGMRVLLPEAREVLRAAGADVRDDVVRLAPEMVTEALASAPASIDLVARNPERSLALGGAHTNFFSVGGPPFCADLDRGRRTGAFEDFTAFMKLCQHYDVVHALAPCVEATDVPLPLRHLETTRAQLTLTDKLPYIYARGRDHVRDCFDMVNIAHGIDDDGLREAPRAWININTNSPLQLDVPMAMAIIDAARLMQPVIMTPFTLAGAMAPVTLAGALVLQHLEALFAITLAQVVQPGAPVVYGAFTSNVDLRSGSPAFGTPEAMKGAFASGQLARHIGLPWRSSGSSASNAPDAQGGYETMINTYGALMGGADIVLHAAGWQEGGLTASFEKFVLDVEMLQILAEAMQPIAVNDDELALDAIRDVGPGGHFFGTDHTIERFETAFYEPIVFTRATFEQWEEDGAHTADVRANAVWKQVLREYEAPPIDDAVSAELDDFVARRTAEGGSAPD